MMKRAGLFMLILCTVFFLFSCSASTADASANDIKPVELTIAAAASLTDVTKEIKAAYASVAPNATLTFTYASSGSLQTQIEQGAPIDIFMSAAQKQMNALEEQELLWEDTRINLLENKVVLITPKDTMLTIGSFEDLASKAITMVAMGDPASVPAGQYAKEVLNSLGIADDVLAKANLGTDVRQVLTWVESAEVDCGIVYATDAATSSAVSVVCAAPKGSEKAIIYPVAVLASSENLEEAQALINFLGTETCQKIFANYGFTMAK